MGRLWRSSATDLGGPPGLRGWISGQASRRAAVTGCAGKGLSRAGRGSRIKATGYGAGGRETPGEPNLLRLLVGEAAENAVDSSAVEPIAVIETVIDDSTPQVLAYVSELLLEAGAWDVYRIAVQMKKGRTGVQVTV